MLSLRRVPACLLVFVQLWAPVLSQTLPITVDKSMRSQQAIVGAGANGVPVVNIARPNGAGVSNNRFTQFNVGPAGVVFNNSGAPSQSQLAGGLAGNPLLGNGRAALIINQVTANNPSQLRGWMEVAGHRANVIVANPAGITCDGCGFLNANRGTLTTGRPMLGADGGLQGFDVTRGRLSVEGLGLYGTGVDKVDLITRALVLNAAVQANQLNVVAGPATVGYDDGRVQAKAGEGPAPAVWLDMAALGGMYANSIRLIGTEAGVGVNIGGAINSLTGQLHLNAAGDLRILPTGQVYSGQGLDLRAGGELAVQGRATTPGDLRLTAGQGLRVDGPAAQLGGANVTMAGNDVAISGTIEAVSGPLQIRSARDLRVSPQGSVRGAKDVDLHAGGELSVQGRATTPGSMRLAAGMGLRVEGAAADVSGNSVTLTGQDITIGSGSKLNSESVLSADARGRLDSAGELRADGKLALNSHDAITLAGETISKSDDLQFRSHAQGITLSPSAITRAAGMVSVVAQDKLLIDGALIAGQSASLQAGSNLENRGWVQVNGPLTATAAGQVVNHGDLHAKGSVTLQASGAMSNDGTVRAGTDLTVTSGGGLVNDGKLLASNRATLNSQRAENHGVIHANDGIQLQAAEGLDNRQGKILSAGDIRLEIQGGLDNRDGSIDSNGKVYVAGREVNNRSGTVRGRNVDVLVPGQVDNTRGLIGADDKLGLSAASVINHETVHRDGEPVLGIHATTAEVRADAFDNRGGHVEVDDQLTVNGKRLSNVDGRVVSHGELELHLQGEAGTSEAGASQREVIRVRRSAVAEQAGSDGVAGPIQDTEVVLDNQRGEILAAKDLTLDLNGAADNRVGRIHTDGQLRGEAVAIDNRGGVLVGKNVEIKTTGGIDNRAGLIGARDKLRLSAGSIDNAQTRSAPTGPQLGIIGKTVVLDAPVVNNATGNIGGQQVTINGKRMHNGGGWVRSWDGIDITMNGSAVGVNALANRRSVPEDKTGQALLDNQGGLIEGGGETKLGVGGSVDNQSGTISSSGGLVVDAYNFKNQSGDAKGKDVRIKTPGHIDNTGGLIKAEEDLALEGGSLNNAGTKRSDTAESDEEVPAERAAESERGIIGGKTSVDAGNIDNRNGHIHGDKSVRATADALDNADGMTTTNGTASIDAGTLKNKDGGIWSGEKTSAQVGRIEDVGTVESKGDIDLFSKESLGLKPDDKIIANGNVSVVSGSDIHNAGTMSGGESTQVTGTEVDNKGTIDSGGSTTVRARERLINENLINGDKNHIAAKSIDNAGRVYGNKIEIEADSLRNGSSQGSDRREGDGADGRGKTGVIAAHDRIDMGVKTFDNDHADVYSGGDLNIGRQLDASGNAVGKADVFNNKSGLIDVDGNLRLDASIINNVNEHFVSEMVPGTNTRKVYYQRPGKDEKLNADEYWLCNYDKPVCTKNYEWVLRTSQRRLLMPSTKDKYNAPQYGPELSYAEPKHASLRRGEAPIKAPYSPPRDEEDSNRNRTHIPEQFNYPIDAPIWDVFEVKRPEPLPPKPAEAICIADEKCHRDNVAYTKAHKAKVAAYEELNKRVRAFNKDFKNRLVKNFDIHVTDEKVFEPRVVSSDPAKIWVGGNATFDGKVLNDKSQIIAGGELLTVGGDVRNLDAIGERRTETTGKVIRTYTSKGGRKHKTVNHDGTTEVESIRMPVSYAGHTAKPGGAWAMPAFSPAAAGDAPFGAFSLRVPGIGEVRTVVPPLSLPSSALYSLRHEAGSAYLVNTDPQFVGGRSLISSDYLFERLGGKVAIGGRAAPGHPNAPSTAGSAASHVEGFDGARLLKRLGDAFYEQRLVSTQITAATGQRFVGDYRDNQSQYKALLTEGAAFGQKFGLTVGAALTDDQMRRMTSDLVWMVARDVQLPDGTSQRVLAPQVYLMVQDGDLKGDGTLMAGRRVAMAADGDIDNTGTIASRDATVMTAENIRNRSGGHLHGGSLNLSARQDFDNVGSRISGGDVALSAGRDVNLNSTSTHSAGSHTWRNYIDSVSSIDATNVSVVAARDLNMAAGSLTALNDVQLAAGGDVTLSSLQDGQGERFVFGKKNNKETSRSQDIGTTLSAGGNLGVIAGADFTATAARLHAGKSLDVLAGGDIALNAGEQSEYFRDEHYRKTRGFLTSKSTHTIDAMYSSMALGTALSGESISLLAGGDIATIAAQVAADKNVRMGAQRDIILNAGADTYGEQHYERVKRKGFFGGGGGIGVAYGKEIKTKWSSLDGVSQSTAATRIGTTNGNVALSAGGDVRLNGAQLVAGSAGNPAASTGNIGIAGKNVSIDVSHDTERTTQGASYTRSVFGMSLVGTPLDTVRNLRRANSLMDIVGEVAATGTSNPQLNLSYNATRSRAETQRVADVAIGSTLDAANDVILRAAEAQGSSPTRGQISLVGATVRGGGVTALDAQGDVSIKAASHQYSESHSSKSKSVGIGTASAGLSELARAQSGGPNSGGVQVLPYNHQVSRAKGQTDASSQTISTVSGRTVLANSQNGDVRVHGSAVVGDDAVTLLAQQGSIHIEPGMHTGSSSESYKQSTVGNLDRSNTSTTIGYGKQRGSEQETGQTQSAAASQVTSRTGDVTLGARDQVSVTGSHIDAGRDLNVQAKVIEITAGRDSIDAQSEHQRSQAGVTFSVNSPVISAVQTAHEMRKAAAASDDPRHKALAATAVGLSMANTYNAIMRNPASAGGISFNVDVGVANSKQRQESSTSAATPSTLQAGRDANLKASGDGSRILIEGSHVTAARNAALRTDGDLLLKAAATTQKTESEQSSNSASVGVGFAVGGTQNGITINAAASVARGEAKGNSVTWNPTKVLAGGVATLQTGGDADVLGSQVGASQIVADIGGDLKIESLQDTAEYSSEQSSGGIGVSLCLPPICYGASSVSGQVGGGRIKSAYASVTQQAGLMAGDGGFQVYVNGETSLIGGVMSSSARAVAEGLNYLDTGTLITRDVENKAWYTGSQFSLGGGYSFGGDAGDKKTGDAAGESQAGQKPSSAVGTDNKGNAASGTRAVPGNALPSFKGVSVAPPGVAQAWEEVESITYSAISGGTIRIRDLDGQRARTGLTADQIIAGLNRDTQDTLNSLDPIFDKDKVEAGFAIIKEVQTQAGTYIAARAEEATAVDQALKDEEAKGAAKDPALIKSLEAKQEALKPWLPGGNYRLIATSLLAGASANVTGPASSAVVAASVTALQGLGAREIKALAPQLGGEGSPAHVALHAVLACAGGAAQGGSCASGAAGVSAGIVFNHLLDKINDTNVAKLSPSEREARLNMLGGLLAGVSSALDPDATAQVAAAAKVEAENNQFFGAARAAAQSLAPIFGQTNSASPSSQSEPMRLIDRARGRDVDSRSGGVTIPSALSESFFMGEEQGNAKDRPNSTPPLIPVIPIVEALIQWGFPEFDTKVPGKSSESIVPVDVPGQVNEGPRSGLTTTTPVIEQVRPILIYHGRDDDKLEAGGPPRGAKATRTVLEKEATGFFGAERKYWSQDPVRFNGNDVYQRNDLIDPNRVDSRSGMTNLDLMKNGSAPYGPDGKKINLHHMLQTQDGPIAEVEQSFHQKNSRAIHINSGSNIPSGINRSQFERWKKKYWKDRAINFEP